MSPESETDSPLQSWQTLPFVPNASNHTPDDRLRASILDMRRSAVGRLFAIVARRKPDIYRNAGYPDANNRPVGVFRPHAKANIRITRAVGAPPCLAPCCRSAPVAGSGDPISVLADDETEAYGTPHEAVGEALFSLLDEVEEKGVEIFSRADFAFGAFKLAQSR